MPRKASGEPKTKRVERRQANGDIYVYEVTTVSYTHLDVYKRQVFTFGILISSLILIQMYFNV